MEIWTLTDCDIQTGLPEPTLKGDALESFEMGYFTSKHELFTGVFHFHNSVERSRSLSSELLEPERGV